MLNKSKSKTKILNLNDSRSLNNSITSVNANIRSKSQNNAKVFDKNSGPKIINKKDS